MEKIQTEVSERKTRRIVIVAAASAFAAVCGAVACGRALKSYTLQDSLDPSVPRLELHVAYYSVDGKPLPVQTSAVASAAADTAGSDVTPAPTASPASTDDSDRCSRIAGGDLAQVKPPAPPQDWWRPTPVPCPLQSAWNVYRHPIAMSFHFKRGNEVFDWYTKNEAFAALRDSSVWRGLMIEMATLLHVRAEDLELADDWKGEFLKPLLAEAVRAKAVLHYDSVHGSKGIVFTFDREEAPTFSKALPILVRGFATNAYTVTDLGQPIVEVRLQGMRIYVAQLESTVLLASGLESLLNVLAEKPFEVPDLDGSLVAVVRPEAYLDKLLTVGIGASTWPIAVSFDLSETKTAIHEATLPPARLFSAFAEKTDEGVMAAIPADALASMVFSAHVPIGVPPTEWTIPSDERPQKGGVAIVWDIDGEKRAYQVGIALPAGTDPSAAREYIASSAEVDLCAGGAIWISASSSRLLARMRESCDRQSRSILDLTLNPNSSLREQQVALLFSPSVALRELYRLGGGKPAADTDISKDELQALQTAQTEVDRTANNLMPFGLIGRLSPQRSGVRLMGVTAHDRA